MSNHPGPPGRSARPVCPSPSRSALPLDQWAVRFTNTPGKPDSLWRSCHGRGARWPRRVARCVTNQVLLPAWLTASDPPRWPAGHGPSETPAAHRSAAGWAVLQARPSRCAPATPATDTHFPESVAKRCHGCQALPRLPQPCSRPSWGASGITRFRCGDERSAGQGNAARATMNGNADCRPLTSLSSAVTNSHCSRSARAR